MVDKSFDQFIDYTKKYPDWQRLSRLPSEALPIAHASSGGSHSLLPRS